MTPSLIIITPHFYSTSVSIFLFTSHQTITEHTALSQKLGGSLLPPTLPPRDMTMTPLELNKLSLATIGKPIPVLSYF